MPPDFYNRPLKLALCKILGITTDPDLVQAIALMDDDEDGFAKVEITRYLTPAEKEAIKKIKDE